MENLPYNCKELINMFALNKYKDYETLKEFNKIIDYEPCEYSNERIFNSEKVYNKGDKTCQRKVNKLLKEYEHKGRSEINFLFYSMYYGFNEYLVEKYFKIDKIFVTSNRKCLSDLELGYIDKKWKWNKDCLTGKKLNKY